jgi:hypothetical protein
VTVLPLHLFTRDALGRTTLAEQPSQVFSFSGLLKLVRDVRFAPIAAKMLQCRE